MDFAKRALCGGLNHIHFEEIDSTQKHVKREFERLPTDRLTLITADFQTDGVGKGDRTWVAAKKKSVLATFAFHFPQGCSTKFCNDNAKNVSHVVALAALQVLRAAVPPEFTNDFVFNMKWPNDVLVNGKKMGGILAEAVTSRDADGAARLGGVIVGIGLNINKSADELAKIKRAVWPAASLLSELPASASGQNPFDVDSIRDNLAVKFFNDLEMFCKKGFSSIQSTVSSMQILVGQEINFNHDDRKEGQHDTTKISRGTFTGIDKDGCLLLKLKNGCTEAMISGEIVPLQRGEVSLSTPLAATGLLLAIGTAVALPRSGTAPLMRWFRDMLEVLGITLFVALGGRMALRLPFTPVPITMQTFCIQLASLIAGPFHGVAAMTLYAVLTIFTDINLGSPKGSKVTCGYILGFIPAAFAYGQPASWPAASITIPNLLMNAMVGSALTYIGGVLGLIFYGVPSPVKNGVLPFLPGDFLKSLTVASIFSRIHDA